MGELLDKRLQEIKDAITKASQTAHDAINALQNGTMTRHDVRHAIDEYLTLMDKYDELCEVVAKPQIEV